MPDLMLTLHTQCHTYAVIHRQEIDLRYVAERDALGTTDSRNRPLHSADLGLMLDCQDASIRERRCAFIVPLRRRSVALVCDSVSTLRPIEEATIVPLPMLLAKRLPHRWVSGVYISEEQPILVLDLREIALHVFHKPVLSQEEPA